MRRIAVRLTPPVRMALEKALAYIEDDELVGVTPKSIRLRSALLDPNAPKRAFRAKESGSTQQHHEGDRGDQPERDVAPSRAARFGLADFRDRSFG